MKKIMLLFIVACSLSACATRIGSVSILSDKIIDTKNVKVSELPKRKNIVGESKRFAFLIPFGRPTIKQALDDALVKGNGDLMLDVSLYQKPYPIIGKFGYEVKGTVVNTRGGNE